MHTADEPGSDLSYSDTDSSTEEEGSTTEIEASEEEEEEEPAEEEEDNEEGTPGHGTVEPESQASFQVQ